MSEKWMPRVVDNDRDEITVMLGDRELHNDRDEITVMLGDRELRGYEYHSEAERRAKIGKAREYVEGWYAGRNEAVEALEWALDNCTESDHPHYPYKSNGRWVYPYLVGNAGGFGGGVGEAAFDTALEAVRSAQEQP